MLATWFEILFSIHALSCAFMCGVSWVMQLVHYPLFRLVSPSQLSAYASAHVRHVSWVVIPAMIAELLSGVYLAVYAVYSAPWETVSLVLLFGLVLLVIVWALTFWVLTPIHKALCKTADLKLVDRLVFNNWFRTLIWSIRLVMLFYASVVIPWS